MPLQWVHKIAFAWHLENWCVPSKCLFNFEYEPERQRKREKPNQTERPHEIYANISTVARCKSTLMQKHDKSDWNERFLFVFSYFIAQSFYVRVRRMKSA